MKLTSFTDHSLRVLIYLAAVPDRRATIAEVADKFEVSKNHLMKVVHFLGTCHWLANKRGKGGGIELSMAPEQINLGQVIRLTEGESKTTECIGLKADHCAIAKVCELKDVLRQAVDAFYKVLDQYTLADVTHNSHGLSKLLRIYPIPMRA